MRWLCRVGLAVFAVFSCGTLSGADVLHLKNGEAISGHITALTDRMAEIVTELPGVGASVGSSRRTLSTEQIEFIEFDFAEGERSAFERRKDLPPEILETWWDFHSIHLHRPRSRTAAWGLAYGQSLMRETSSSRIRSALSVFDRIIDQAWSPDDVLEAKRGRLAALIAQGTLDVAEKEALVFTKEAKDPGPLIEVRYLLAQADFAALQLLEKENPRWEEDDEILPQRAELYHSALDRFLAPHLFHPDRAPLAARGLFTAAEVFSFANETEEAASRWRDLLAFYPETSWAEEARKRLDALPEKESPAPSNPAP